MRGAEVPPTLQAKPEPKPAYDLSDGKRVREEFKAETLRTAEKKRELNEQIEGLNVKINETIKRQIAEMDESDGGWSDEVYEKYKAQIKPMQDERKKLYESRDALDKDAQQIFARVAAVPKAEAVKLDLTYPGTFRGSKKEIKQKTGEVQEWLETFVSNGGQTLKVKVDETKTGRPYANLGSISIDKKEGRNLIAHEIAHNIEFIRGAEARAKRIAFFDKRTAGDAVEKMADAFPGYGYQDDEVFKRDKWQHPYSGKIYAYDNDANAVSEVITMGVQHLYEGAAAFAEKDPEYFDFIVSYLRGTL